MAYQVVVNSAVTIVHPVTNLLGTVPLTGQAGTITKSLLDEGMAASALPVTITEIGVSGHYSVNFTPDAVGTWQLTLVNPAGSDQGTYVYQVQALSQAAISGLTAKDLTTLARVRERLQIKVSTTTFDSLLSALITEESGGIQDRLGRCIGQFAYVHHLDGNDRGQLFLLRGPLVQINSVNEVDYVDGGGGARSETLTLVEAYKYVEHGLRVDGWMAKGGLKRVDGGIFEAGARRWKVDYIAGFSPIPEGLVGWTISRVINTFFTREAPLMASSNVGEATIDLLSPAQLAREEQRILMPYRDLGVRW